MNNPPYPAPASQNSSGKKTTLIIITVVIVMCCLCSTLAGGAGAAYYLWLKPVAQESHLPPAPTEEAFPILANTLPAEDAPAFESTSTPEDTPAPVDQPTETPAANEPGQGNGAVLDRGLGVSQAEMIDFYSSGGAFQFGQPTVVQGLEMIQGTHTWLCVEANCAAVTLGGPKDDLEVIAIVVPTQPDDSAQTTLGILLLMTTAARFTDAQATDIIPGQIMDDLLEAQKNSQNLEKTMESSGYVFTETYDAKTHNAGLAISRPK